MGFLASDGLWLRTVLRDDLPLLRDWRNDSELRLRTREFRPLTDVDQEAWYQRISGPHRTNYMFVVDLSGETPIGVVGLCHHNWHDAHAEVSFYIGEKAERGRGYATKALVLLHDWGFSELRLHRIYAEVFAFNKPSIRLLTKLGYHSEGRMRQHVWRDGKWHDSVMMGILKDEWSKSS